MTGPLPVTNSVFYVQAEQHWQVEQEIYRHQQPLYRLGEPALFFLMWTYEDFVAGYVDRCPRCWSALDEREAQVYQQPVENKCPYCFGTTFEGGVRARIVRPAFFNDADDDETQGNRGVLHPAHVNVQTASDFRSRTGDYVVRADNSRWRLGRPVRTQLRSGYGHPSQAEDGIGYGMIPADLEDKTSVAYLLSPSDDDSVTTLLTTTSAFPPVIPDIINGPLIPKAVIS